MKNKCQAKTLNYNKLTRHFHTKQIHRIKYISQKTYNYTVLKQMQYVAVRLEKKKNDIVDYIDELTHLLFAKRSTVRLQ